MQLNTCLKRFWCLLSTVLSASKQKASHNSHHFSLLFLETVLKIPHIYSSLKNAEIAIERHQTDTNSNFCVYRADKSFNQKGKQLLQNNIAYRTNYEFYIIQPIK